VELGVSIRAPREGGDVISPINNSIFAGFNPRPPRRGRLLIDPKLYKPLEVSIRAPREGGDNEGSITIPRNRSFNPRPPRRGRRMTARELLERKVFQSAPPAKGATLWQILAQPLTVVSIRAPREGGDRTYRGRPGREDVSIRAPREGGDNTAI